MDKQLLESLVNEGLSQRQIAKRIGLSATATRYRLKKFGLSTKRAHQNRNKNSVFFTIPDDEFASIVASSHNIAECLRKLLGKHDVEQGAHYRRFHERVKALGLSIDHFDPWADNGKFTAIPDEELFVANSTSRRTTVRKRILQKKLLEYTCSACGVGDSWQGRKLSLYLDHINGVNNDHRLENLRFLCPNCHSQTSTFGAKNRKGTYETEAMKEARRVKAIPKPRLPPPTKIDWPSDEELAKLVWQEPRSALAKRLGVSDVAIAKRCRKHNIAQPPRGYWAKMRAGKL